MTRLRVLMKNLFRRGAFEDQMTEEVQSHIDSRAADLIRSALIPARRAASVDPLVALRVD
jgi:hypothetical protein